MSNTGFITWARVFDVVYAYNYVYYIHACNNKYNNIFKLAVKYVTKTTYHLWSQYSIYCTSQPL